MASEDSNLPLWDVDNPDQQCLVLYTLRYSRCLQRNQSKLKQLIKLETLCPRLLNQGIINPKEQHNIQQGASDQERVERLLTSIREGACWRLHGLLKALCEDGQEKVVELLGLDPDTYRGASQEHSVTATSTATASLGHISVSKEQETSDPPEAEDQRKRQHEDRMLDANKGVNVKTQLGQVIGDKRGLSPPEEEQVIPLCNAGEEQDSNANETPDTKTKSQERMASSSKTSTDAQEVTTNTFYDEEKDLYQEKERSISEQSDIQRQPADESSLQELTDADTESQRKIMLDDESEISCEPVSASDTQSAGRTAAARVHQPINQPQKIKVNNEHKITDEKHAQTVSSKAQGPDNGFRTDELNENQDSSDKNKGSEDSGQQVEQTGFCDDTHVSCKKDVMNTAELQACSQEVSSISIEEGDARNASLMGKAELTKLRQEEQIQYNVMLTMEQTSGSGLGANSLLLPHPSTSLGAGGPSTLKDFSPIDQHKNNPEDEGLMTGNFPDPVGLQEDISIKEQQSEHDIGNQKQQTLEYVGEESDTTLAKVSDDSCVEERDLSHEIKRSSHRRSETLTQSKDEEHSAGEYMNAEAQQKIRLPEGVQVAEECRKMPGQELVTASTTHIMGGPSEHMDRTDEVGQPLIGEHVIYPEGCMHQSQAVEVALGHESTHQKHDKTAEEVKSLLETTDSGFITSSLVDCSTTRGEISEYQDRSGTDKGNADLEQAVEGISSISSGSDSSEEDIIQIEALQALVCSHPEDTSDKADKHEGDLNTSFLSEADLSNLSEAEQIEFAMILSTQDSARKDPGESMEVVPYQSTSTDEIDDTFATAAAERFMENMVEERDPMDQLRNLVLLASIVQDVSAQTREASDSVQQEYQPEVMMSTIYFLDLSMMTPEDQMDYAMYQSLLLSPRSQQPTFSKPEERVRIREVLSIADVSEMTEEEQLEYTLKISAQPSATNDGETVTTKLKKEDEEEEGHSLNISSEPSSVVKNLTKADEARVSNIDESKPSMDSKVDGQSISSRDGVTAMRADDNERAAISMKERIKNNTVNLIDTLDVRLFEHLLQPHLVRVTQEQETRKDKTRSLLEQLRRDPEEQSITFLHVISGLYPELVAEVTGRKPTRPQANICIRGFCADLKTVIKEMGNVPDAQREKICLDNQYVQLRLVKDKQKSLEEDEATKNRRNSSGDEDEAMEFLRQLWEEFKEKDDETEDDQQQGTEDVLPDMYQGYLEGSIKKMEPKDIILNLKSGGMVLLRGRAGIGKTTFVQWLVRQWLLGRWAKQFTVVFVLNLRYLARLDYSMTLSELLTQYSVYNTSKVHPQFPLWLAKSPDHVVLIIEGLDELSQLEHLLKQTKPIQSGVDVTAKPIEWVINIIRCNIIPSCCKILTSRPFTALKTLEPDRTVELLGLTRSAVKEFIKRNVKEDKQELVLLSLETNPHLMSSCGITFYCAAICRLLEEGVIFSDAQLNTYTRITAFLILKMALRQEPDTFPGPAGCAQALGDVLPPLARLAKHGLMQGKETEKLVFSQADFLKAKISKPEQIAMEKSGLIPSMTIKDPHTGEHLLAEYLHLSIQEILATAEILQSDDSQIEDALRGMSHTGRFNMAELFVVGLALDKESEWVTSLRDGVGFKLPEGKVVPDAASKVRDFCLNMVKDDHEQDQSVYLRGIQATYESRDVELAENMSKKFGLQEDVMISNTPLTSIDVNGLLFVLHHTQNIHSVMLTDVNLDDWSMELLLRFMCERKSIQRLNLNGNQITDTGLRKLFNKDEFPQLKNRFTVISLRGNQITDQGIEDVSKSLSENTSLTSLNLGHNDVSDVGAETLSTVLLKNVTLETLNLRGTKITDNGLLSLMEAINLREKSLDLRVSARLCTDLQRVLDKGGALKDETTLKLSRAGITTEGISHLANVLQQEECQLSSLNLGHNHLTDEDTDHLCSIIKEAPALGTLNLEETKITNNGLLALLVAINDVGRPVTARFSRQLNEGLRGILENGGLLRGDITLNLNHARLNGKGIDHLAVLMRNTDTIKGLNLSHNCLTDEEMETLAIVLCDNTSLEALDLEVASITNDGLLALLEAVNRRGKPLEVSVSDQLNADLRAVLKDGGLLTTETQMNLNHSGVTQKGIQHLAAILGRNVEITSLRLVGSCLDSNTAMMLCESLMVNTSLQLLELSHNQICDTGAQKVAEVMLVNTHLQDLRLSHCQITDSGVDTLTEAIRAATMGLQNLELAFNKITDTGAGKLALVLEEKNAGLQKLELSGNLIGTEGTGKLAKALTVNTSLSHLELSYNQITDDAAETLADAVASNTTLQEVSLSGNQITDGGAQKLAEALQTNTNMKSLCLAWNKIAVVDVEKRKRPKWPVMKLRIGYDIHGDSSDDSSDSDDETDSVRDAAGEAAVEPGSETASEPAGTAAALEPASETVVELASEAADDAAEPQSDAALDEKAELEASEKLDVNVGIDGSKDSINTELVPVFKQDADTLDSDSRVNTEADAVDVHVPTAGDAVGEEETFKTEVHVVYSTRL